MSLRDRIRHGMNFSGTTMVEIGALCRPFLLKSECDVRYVDHADTETLQKKYAGSPDVDVDAIVHVDAIWGENTLQQSLGGDVKADYVLASHVIEHVPDLLTWLKELRSILKPGGEIRLAIPDKRFTFDYIRRETALQDVIDAYLRRARRPLPANIFDHVAYARKVEVGMAWKGPIAPEDLEAHHSFQDALDVATDALCTSNYHDVHCWIFTPRSFAQLMKAAAQNGMLDFVCNAFEDTQPNTMEFTVFLSASSDQQAICDSWERMESGVNEWITGPSPLQLEIAKGIALERELEELRSREKALQQDLNTAQATAAAYASSTSWKITKPLRTIISSLRGVQR